MQFVSELKSGSLFIANNGEKYQWSVAGIEPATTRLEYESSSSRLHEDLLKGLTDLHNPCYVFHRNIDHIEIHQSPKHYQWTVNRTNIFFSPCERSCYFYIFNYIILFRIDCKYYFKHFYFFLKLQFVSELKSGSLFIANNGEKYQWSVAGIEPATTRLEYESSSSRLHEDLLKGLTDLHNPCYVFFIAT